MAYMCVKLTMDSVFRCGKQILQESAHDVLNSARTIRAHTPSTHYANEKISCTLIDYSRLHNNVHRGQKLLQYSLCTLLDYYFVTLQFRLQP